MRSANEIAAKLLNSNFLAQALPAAQAATALADWEAEGGAMVDSLRMLHGESQVAESHSDELLAVGSLSGRGSTFPFSNARYRTDRLEGLAHCPLKPYQFEETHVTGAVLAH